MANVTNPFPNKLVKGTADNDTITSTVGAKRVTINAFAGDDVINLKSKYSIVNGDAGNDSINNLSDFSTLNGGDGNDFIYNNADNEVLIDAGAGNNYIYNSALNATIKGTSGFDKIINRGERALIIGGSNKDTIRNLSGGNHSTINSGNGNDSIENYAYNTTIDSGLGNDSIDNYGANEVSINGGDNDDVIANKIWSSGVTINGGKGDDIISLAGGNEVLQYVEGDGNDIVYGFNSKTKLDFKYDSVAQAGNDVVLKVGNGAITLIDTDKYLFYDKIIGTEGNDEIKNTLSAQYISVGAGNDYVDNYAKDVFIDGGNDNDILFSYNNDTTIYGGAGNDNLISGLANNFLKGGAGNDTIYSLQNATVLGGDGNDYINSLGSNNTLDGGNGNDTIVLWNNATVNAGVGDDIISISGDDKVNIIHKAGDGNDTVLGFNDKTMLKIDYDSAEQRDNGVLLKINDGSILIKDASINNFFTYITGTNGNDTINNTFAKKQINALAGDDVISNSGENVSINGGDGNDSIDNSADNVTINGGKGNDVIDLGRHSAFISYANGDGNDTIYGYAEGSSVDFIYDDVDQSGNDVIFKIGSGSLTFKNTDIAQVVTFDKYSDANDTINNENADKIIDAGAGNNHITNSGSGVIISSGDGKDSITNSGKRVNIKSGAGDDSITNSADNVKINGGNDQDAITNSGKDVITDGGNGNDSINNTAENVTINGGNGQDTISNSGNNVIIDGGADNDSINNTAENVTINAGAGNNVISLNGGYGAIMLDATAGNDSVYGFSKQNYSCRFDYDSLKQSGSNVIMTVGNRIVTFVNTPTSEFVEGKNFSIKYSAGYHEGTEGNDSFDNFQGGYYSTINALGGNDTIQNREHGVLMYGGEGDDYFYNYGDFFFAGNNVTIDGGKGNDLIRFASGFSQAVIVYNEGDGNDVVEGFSNKSTLKATYDSAEKSGNDVIVKIGKGSITFKDTSINLFKVNGNHQFPASDAYDNIAELIEPSTANLNDELKDILSPSAINELGAFDSDASNVFSTVNKTFETNISAVNRRHRKI